MDWVITQKYTGKCTDETMGKNWRYAVALLALSVAVPARADITNVRVQDVTSTQAILKYTAPDANACAIEVSESATFLPLVHDVDPALFAGANLDSASENVSDDLDRSVVLGKR